jgi:hypothetical protein
MKMQNYIKNNDIQNIIFCWDDIFVSISKKSIIFAPKIKIYYYA